jgi:hypothetical protein
MTEPRLPAELAIADADLPVRASEYYPAILRSLALQLGVRNDFYYPLLGAATLLEPNN